MPLVEPAFILIHPLDNVLVCCRHCEPGLAVQIDGVCETLREPIGVGHKIARRPLAAGETVVKYGAPIGSVTVAIPTGGHVHGHNMRSDYLDSHTRQTANLREETQ